MTYFGIIIHISIHTYIHSILAYIHTDVYVCMLVYVCVYVYVCMYMYACICMYVCICMCVCMYVYVCVCVCIHVYVSMHNILGELSGGNVLPKTGGGIVRG